MAIKFTNNASAPLASAISSSSTAIILTAGRGSAFPTLGANDYFYATLINPANQLEIVKCTARTGDTLTVVRGQDGTAARAYSAGDKLELRITAAGMEAKFDVSGGEVSNAGTPLEVNSTDSTLNKVKLKDNGTVRGYLGASSTRALSIGNSTGTEVGYVDQTGNFYPDGAVHPTKIVFPDTTEQSTAFVQPIPTGTVMLFVQSTAPTGWTKSTAHNDKALRVVSGSVSSGGSVAFSTAFASQAVSGSVGSTTLSIAQMPGHTHTIEIWSVTGGEFSTSRAQASLTNGSQVGSSTSSSTGGGGSHTHSFTGTAINMAVQYVDVIIASKN